MKKAKFLFVTAGAILVFLACNDNTPPLGSGAPVPNQPIPADCFCVDTTLRGSLCDTIPNQVLFSPGNGYSSVLSPKFQGFFDEFSWQSFIALNWPADASGNPTGSFNSNPYNQRVWESSLYPNPATVFSSQGVTILTALKNGSGTGAKVLFLTTKFNPAAFSGSEGVQQADGKALIDQNGNFTLYEERMNPVEYGYIQTNSLTTKKGITTYGSQHGNALTLPASSLTTRDSVGSMEIKAAWRILIPGVDDTSRYYTRNATIIVPKGSSSDTATFTFQAKVGLVGMHIAHKVTPFQNSQIWSTFEHVDNCPDSIDVVNNKVPNKKYSYYSPACNGCPYNTAINTPADFNYIWQPGVPYGSLYMNKVDNKLYGTQVIRDSSLYVTTVAANTKFQAKLQGTVWANYKLVGTQWQFGATDAPPFTPTPPAPHHLANTTMETFIQGTSSCIDCHKAAKIKYQDTITTTDFSFLFGHAK